MQYDDTAWRGTWYSQRSRRHGGDTRKPLQVMRVFRRIIIILGGRRGAETGRVLQNTIVQIKFANFGMRIKIQTKYLRLQHGISHERNVGVYCTAPTTMIFILKTHQSG